MKAGWCYRLYGWRNRHWRDLVRRVATWLEGGEMYSETLRRIFRQHHGIDAGLYSYGCFRPDQVPSGTVIGRYCSFAQGATVFNANHPLDHRSLHPFFYNPAFGYVREEQIERGQLRIGHDVWVGRNAMITPRVRQIGNGAVIGAGAVVTRDVPAYAIVAGNPARIVRYRFGPKVREELEASRWWELPIEQLTEDDMEAFLRPLKGHDKGEWGQKVDEEKQEAL